jgi:5-methylcytosine-specific restriction enzyme A
VPAPITDQVEPHGDDPNKFFLGELQSLCKPRHDSGKRFMEINGYGLDGWSIDPLCPTNRVR